MKKIFAVLSTGSEYLRTDEVFPLFPLLKEFYSSDLEFERKAMELDTNKEGTITWEQFVPIGRQLVDAGYKINDIKKQVFGETAMEFSQEQMNKLRGIFHFMDEDSSGRIDELELLGSFQMKLDAIENRCNETNGKRNFFR